MASNMLGDIMHGVGEAIVESLTRPEYDDWHDYWFPPHFGPYHQYDANHFHIAHEDLKRRFKSR